MEELFRLSQTQLKVFDRPYKRYFLKEHNLTHRLGIFVGQRGEACDQDVERLRGAWSAFH
jgi:hypothetical protein